MTIRPALIHHFGTFEGFNFRASGAIERTLTGQEVLDWDHDAQGEAEFWPSGDHAGLRHLFQGRTSVTARELLALDRLLQELGSEDQTTFLRIAQARHHTGLDLEDLTGRQVEDQVLYIFQGTNFHDTRKEAAYELFETFHPEAYQVWDTGGCDGLIFDTDVFLDSPSWSVEEVRLGENVFVLVWPA